MNDRRDIPIKHIIIASLVAMFMFVSVSILHFRQLPSSYVGARFINSDAGSAQLIVEMWAHDYDDPFLVDTIFTVEALDVAENLEVVAIPSVDRIICRRVSTGETIELVLQLDLAAPDPLQEMIWSDEASALQVEFPGRTIDVRPGRQVFRDRIIEIIIHKFIMACLFGLMVFASLGIGAHYVRCARRRRGKCPNCTYEVRAIDSDRCPECGAAISTASKDEYRADLGSDDS